MKIERSLSPEDELVITAQLGSNEAFESLVKPLRQALLRLANGYLRNRDDAEEVTQQALLRAFQKVRSFRFESSFKTWLYRITINECKMRIRKKRPSLQDFPRDDLSTGVFAHPWTNADDYVREQELLSAVDEAFASLSDDHRRILQMRAYENMMPSEIADNLKMSLSGTKSRLHRARRAVRDNMEKTSGLDPL